MEFMPWDDAHDDMGQGILTKECKTWGEEFGSHEPSLTLKVGCWFAGW